jgi:hypothetical protein
MPIMYVCEPCYVDCSEGCGHMDRTEVRVLPDGRWVCEGCFDDLPDEALGLPADYDGLRPFWSSFSPPPEYKPAQPK